MMAAGVVLAGGRSSRMGTSKALLEWEGTTLLARTCDVLAAAVDGPVLVVRSPGQRLPTLPASIEVDDDVEEGLGPVQALAVGLRAVLDRVEVAFVCATDLPFLQPAFVRRVVRAAQGRPDAEALVPVVHGRTHPLAAAYRTSLAGPAQDAVAARRLRLQAFLEGRQVVHIGEADLLRDRDLAATDPDLQSVTNVNDPQAYARARDASRG